MTANAVTSRIAPFTLALGLMAVAPAAGAQAAWDGRAWDVTGAPFAGGYAGVEAGMALPTVKLSQPSAAARSTLGGAGVGGGLFAGWGARLGTVYVGLEARAHLTDSDHTTGIGAAQVRLEADHSLGLAFRSGAVVHERVLVYYRVGVTQARFTGTETVAGQQVSRGVDLTGYAVGGGVEVLVLPALSVRADYTHTVYETWRLGGTDLKPRDNLVSAGAALRF